MKYFGTWNQPIIPDNETIKVGVRDWNNKVIDIIVAVTPDILEHISGTKEGSFHTINLRLLAPKLPPCKSFFIY
jgi:hypothetical protein